MDTSKIGTKIKILCEKTGLSKECFAIYLGLDQTQIAKFEEGEFRLNVNQLEKVCDLFSCSFRDLINHKSDNLEQDYTFNFSMRTTDDLLGIAAINKIAQNLKEMNAILTAGTMS